MFALIIYFIGVIIAIWMFVYHIKNDIRNDEPEITLSSLLVIIFAGILSWFSVLVVVLNWIYYYGERIVIYKFKNKKKV